MAKRDMPPFLKQDRPAKVKEIYRALKRDHPGMSAEKKARIASSKGKSKLASQILLGALSILREGHRPLVKVAATEYLYEMQKDGLDEDALGAQFCKLASVLKRDPWQLAADVAINFRGYSSLAKTAENSEIRNLAKFYVNWAEQVKEAAVAKTVRKVVDAVKRRVSKAKSPPSTAASPGPGYSFGEKALGAAVIGLPVAGGLTMYSSSRKPKTNYGASYAR